jgi:mannose-6-phosphate isomerase-like protein (cupin superfamily)
MGSNLLNRRKLVQLFTATFAGAPLSLSRDAEDPKPLYIAPNSGEKGKIGVTDITFKLGKEQTMGNLGSAEMILQPGYLGAPPHLHKGFDEICIVLQGTLHIMVGEEVFEVPAGGWHLRPRGLVHTFWNLGKEPAKFIELYTPAGHEMYMKDLAKLFANNQRPIPGDLQKLAKEHDIEFRFDRLPAILQKYKVQL